MGRLALFELEKIWKKHSFLLAMFLILLVHGFLLWYTSQSNGEDPDLSAYKILEQELHGMSEEEKWSYVEQQYKDIQGVNLVNDVLNCQNFSGEQGRHLAEQLKSENPGIFEQYYDTYQEGRYLHYTNSLAQEYQFLTEIYEEIKQVSGYQKYLQEIQARKGTLNQISIFASADGDSFSEKNIEKSAGDYLGLENVRICYYPSKGIVSAVTFGFQDLFLMASVFLFATSLIYEEKEKKLFYVTRATVRGRLGGIGAKLLALLIHCIGFTGVLYGINLLWYGSQAGLGDLSRSIQSVTPYMECTLHWNVLGGIVCMVVTKAAVLFVLGTVLMAAAVALAQAFMPWLLGCAVLLVSLLMNVLVPDYSAMNGAKYLNLLGLMQTDILYGNYLNFNFFGYPVSRLWAALAALGIYMLAGIGVTLGLFLRFRTPELDNRSLLERNSGRIPRFLQFHAHASLYRHEGYKIFVMNRALAVLLLLGVFSVWQHASVHYSLSPYETYYQNMLVKLEGKLTGEKERLIETEQKRYEEAFAQIARIDDQIAAGEINEMAGESMKSPYYNETAFYPVFEKVLDQYETAKEQGINFIYDTGYLYLFGVEMDTNQEEGTQGERRLSDSVFLTDLILFSLCLILSFSNVLTMEDEKKSWNLLSATATGKKEILQAKRRISLIASGCISLVPWTSRLITIGRVYPLRQVMIPLNQIPAFYQSGVKIPVIIWLLIMLLTQMLTLAAITQVVLFCSGKMKSYLQALFIGVLFLMIPLLLTAMGFDFIGWCSLLPLYELTSMIVQPHGMMIAAGYGVAAVLVLVCGK